MQNNQIDESNHEKKKIFLKEYNKRVNGQKVMDITNYHMNKGVHCQIE